MKYTAVTAHLIVMGIMAVCFVFCTASLFAPGWIRYVDRRDPSLEESRQIGLIHNDLNFEFITFAFVFLAACFILLIVYLIFAVLVLAVKLKARTMIFIDFIFTAFFSCDFLFILVYFSAAVLRMDQLLESSFRLYLSYSYFTLIPCFICCLVAMGFSGTYWYKMQKKSKPNNEHF